MELYEPIHLENPENTLNSKYLTKLHQSYKAFTINSLRIIFLGLWKIKQKSDIIPTTETRGYVNRTETSLLSFFEQYIYVLGSSLKYGRPPERRMFSKAPKTKEETKLIPSVNIFPSLKLRNLQP